MMLSARLTAADGTPFATVDAYLAHVAHTGEAGRLARWLAGGCYALAPRADGGASRSEQDMPAEKCAPSAPRSMPPTSTSRARTL